MVSLVSRGASLTSSRSLFLFPLAFPMSGTRRPQFRPSSDLASFRAKFADARRVVILTGAGVSAESGVPTFRGAGGFWRKFQAQDLATPEAFERDPSLVWEFYHYRREVMRSKNPNPAHEAIARCQKRLKQEGKHCVVITQNIDELHKRAGTEDLIELHGSLFRTRCLKCGHEAANHDSPICEALRDKGEPDPSTTDAKIPEQELPRCNENSCGGLLRPAVVWFGEGLDKRITRRTMDEISSCDACLVVGTSSVVYPAAMYAPMAAQNGATVAEFNMETTPVTNEFGFHFQGPAGEMLPKAIDVE